RFGADCEIAGATVARQRSALTERHAKQEVEYAGLMAKQREATSRAADRVALQRRYAEVATAPRELAAREAETAQLDRQIQEKQAKLAAVRAARSEARRALSERVSTALAPQIRVTIDDQSNKSAYQKLLNSMLKALTTRPEPTSKPIVAHVDPPELVE